MSFIMKSPPLDVAAMIQRVKERLGMHYKNGREAKNGDKVVVVPAYGPPYAGILYDAQPGNDHCNGRVAVTSPSDPMPNLKECLHADDVKAADIPDTTQAGGKT